MRHEPPQYQPLNTPPHILEAARVITEWAKSRKLEGWRLHGCHDAKSVAELEKALNGWRLLEPGEKLKPGMDEAFHISVSRKKGAIYSKGSWTKIEFYRKDELVKPDGTELFRRPVYCKFDESDASLETERERIKKDHVLGLPAAVIATKYGLTRKKVCKILKIEKQLEQKMEKKYVDDRRKP